MILYYITDRTQFPGDEPARRRRLLDKISEAARSGLDLIQLREKDLTAHELELLAREASDGIARLRTENQELRTALLLNSRTDVALATGAGGVHLRSDDISAATVRKIWSRGAGDPARAVVAVSCHSITEVGSAASSRADFAVFAPVFEKKGVSPTGLEPLCRACQLKIPVLALGGVTLENAQACLKAGAAGIAGIRLFQENELSQLIPKLRALRTT